MTDKRVEDIAGLREDAAYGTLQAWLDAGFAIARAGIDPDYSPQERGASHALDTMQHLHLAGAWYAVVPQMLRAADAADDYVRVPRENIRHLIEYIGAMYEKAAFEPRNRSAERALNTLADDIEGWLDGNFKKVPDGQA